MPTETVSSAELAQARGKLYEFMSAQFAGPPDAEMLVLVADWASQQMASDSAGEWLSPEMNDALAAIGGFFQGAGDRSREDLGEEVAIEYTRLFRGIKKEYSPPPPYESVYREEDGRVFGEVTTVVRNQYRRHGFDVASGLTSEPSDHISLELEFMHLLCTREAEALAAKDDEAASDLRLAQREFLEEHLMAWTPSLRQEVEKFDRGGLFSGLLKFTEGWLDFDYRNHVVEG
ncbi:MAG: molecular chaperone TorD family protein [Dehalococcoidales bacterium]